MPDAKSIALAEKHRAKRDAIDANLHQIPIETMDIENIDNAELHHKPKGPVTNPHPIGST